MTIAEAGIWVQRWIDGCFLKLEASQKGIKGLHRGYMGLNRERERERER